MSHGAAHIPHERASPPPHSAQPIDATDPWATAAIRAGSAPEWLRQRALSGDLATRAIDAVRLVHAILMSHNAVEWNEVVWSASAQCYVVIADSDGDGLIAHGEGVDTDGDGVLDGMALDTDGDGAIDTVVNEPPAAASFVPGGRLSAASNMAGGRLSSSGARAARNKSDEFGQPGAMQARMTLVEEELAKNTQTTNSVVALLQTLHAKLDAVSAANGDGAPSTMAAARLATLEA